MKEFFEIPGFEGLYEISKAQVVVSTERLIYHPLHGFKLKKRRVLKPSKNGDGYVMYHFTKDRKPYIIKLHQLMARTFIPNPNNLPCVRHLNDNRDDNGLDNLAWGTDKDNSQDAVRNGRFPDRAGKNNNLYGKKGADHPAYGRRGSLSPSFGKKGELHPNARIILDKSTGIFYFGIREAAEAKGYSQIQLAKKLRGERKNTSPMAFV
jgi:hypothetical protein